MQATKRTTRRLRHQWVLPATAHNTEVCKAIDTARAEVERRGIRGSDVWVLGTGDEVIVYYDEDEEVTHNERTAREVGAPPVSPLR